MVRVKTRAGTSCKAPTRRFRQTDGRDGRKTRECGVLVVVLLESPDLVCHMQKRGRALERLANGCAAARPHPCS